MRWKITLYAKGYELSKVQHRHLELEVEASQEEAILMAREFSSLMKKTWNGSPFVTGRGEGLESFNIR